jgi:hypothetical protein
VAVESRLPTAHHVIQTAQPATSMPGLRYMDPEVALDPDLAQLGFGRAYGERQYIISRRYSDLLRESDVYGLSVSYNFIVHK